MTKTAFITGALGQDGSYLTELLISKNYRVVGLDKAADPVGQALPPLWRDRVELINWDMRDQDVLIDLLSSQAPDEFYNFAAYTSGAGMYDDPVATGDINGLAVARILEAIRTVSSATRFCQASSSELFGEAAESPQSETTVMRPRSPYGAAKLYAHAMIDIYRKRYGTYACSAILFNHESPRRRLEFVVRKVTHAAAQISLGKAQELRLGDLGARRDWGFAGDYVRAMWQIVQAPSADDYVVATGVSHSVRELCDIAFRHVGLDYQSFVREERSLFREPERSPLVGDASKLKRLGWNPDVDFERLVEMMVDADLELARS